MFFISSSAWFLIFKYILQRILDRLDLPRNNMDATEMTTDCSGAGPQHSTPAPGNDTGAVKFVTQEPTASPQIPVSPSSVPPAYLG
jgi:hypothetical protein